MTLKNIGTALLLLTLGMHSATATGTQGVANTSNGIQLAMQKCFVNGWINQLPDRTILGKCIKESSAWCRGKGISVPPTASISSATGQIDLKSDECAHEITEFYQGFNLAFQSEIDNYLGSLNAGAPYTPVLFDMRQFVGNNKIVVPTE